MKTSQNPLRALQKSERKRLFKLLEFERCAQTKGFKRIAGIDEAGRGPLAGPVVAAVCLVGDHLFSGINDSKLLNPSQRDLLFNQITSAPGVSYAIGIVESEEIDRINILQATIKAMREAVARLEQAPDYLLIDGMDLPFDQIVSEKVIHGDARSQSIAAASILAKVTRDRLMREYHELYPLYGFDQHKGYGTVKHLEAIEKHGPCPIHRLSFSPLKPSAM